MLQHITCLALQLLMFYNLLAVQAHVLHVLQPITGIAQWYKVCGTHDRKKRSSVQVPAGVAGEFSSPGSTFCADSYFTIC